METGKILLIVQPHRDCSAKDVVKPGDVQTPTVSIVPHLPTVRHTRKDDTATGGTECRRPADMDIYRIVMLVESGNGKKSALFGHIEKFSLIPSLNLTHSTTTQRLRC